MNGDQIVFTNYATPTYVVNAISQAIGNPTGTVTEITIGNGLTGSPNPITTAGTIELQANLSDLENVSASAPSTNQVLTWNGTCWHPATFGGTGTSPIEFIDLSDTPGGYANGNLLQSTSNSIQYVTNNFINEISNGPGINHLQQTPNKVMLEVDLSSFVLNNTSQSTDEFIILNSTNNPRRIAQSNIELRDFKDAETYIENTARNGLTGIFPITFNNSNGSIGLSGSVMTGINFNTHSISGTLPIEHGGTSASTSSQARTNLGLSYNTDILAFQNPRYDGFMNGTNVRFAPGTASVEVLTGGTGYDGVGHYVNYNGSTIDLNVLTGTAGEICSASLNGNYYDTLLYTQTLPVFDTSGSTTTGYVQIVPETNYINFGLSQGSNGIGFRNNQGNIEYKYNQGSSWLDFEQFVSTISGSADVSFSSANNNILIYNSSTSKYDSTVLGGQGYITGGNLVITGPVDPRVINVTSGASITSDEFTTLQGISSNIQQQLNEKIYSENNPTDGAVLYYKSSTGSSTVWSSLNPLTSDQDKVLTVDFTPGISPLIWKDPFESIGSCMIPETSGINIGSSTQRWSTTFTDVLNLNIYSVGTAPEGISGSLAVFSDGNYGSPCLGLYWGSCWNIIGISGSINAGP